MTVTVIKNRPSSTAPTTTVIYGGLSGPVGPAGPSGAEALTRTALGSVQAFYVVSSINATQVAHTDPSSLESITSSLGISLQSATNGNSVDIKTNGVVNENSWSWTPDLPVFVGSGGQLTQTAPSSGYLRRVGVALSATSIAISFGSIVRRS